MLRKRRIYGLMFLCAALAGLGLEASPSLCHPEDEACRTNPQHHTAVNCDCSCHMGVVIPPSLPPFQGPALLWASHSQVIGLLAVFLNEPVPPPRS